MNRLRVFYHGHPCGILEKHEEGAYYCFTYDEDYTGMAISLTLPLQHKPITFPQFPPFFEGLLPEGWAREGLLQQQKIASDNYMAQLAHRGQDLLGAITVQQLKEPA